MTSIKIIFLFSALASACGGPSARFPQDVDLRPWKSNRDTLSAPEEYSSINRLPTTVVPTHYKLNMRPILGDGPGQFTSPGNVTITVTALESTDRITINSRAITLDTDSLKVLHVATNLEIPIASTSSDNIEFTFTMHLSEPLEASEEYTVFINFTSPIPNTILSGLYRSSYRDPITDEVRYLAATQFQRSSARRAFPCFDEPAFRAVFEISLGRTEDYHTLCNMEIRETTPDGNLEGWVWDHYEPTVNMPSYLIAIVVSDFKFEAAPPEMMNGKISKAWASPVGMTPGAGVFAAETSAKVITYFEEVYQATYDLPKLDSAAIPDFSAGAMENWGLVLYRENLLLYYNGTTTEASRRSISSVISHELAHQWFGNLVTNQWWNDIWLNEGFATYVSYWGVNATDPEYDPFNWIMPDSYQAAMSYDIGFNSQPVSNDGTNPSAIIYDKGAAIIRMMEGFLTERTLRTGLQKYLQRHAYGVAQQDDLFVALNEQAILDGTLDPNLSVKLVMDTWTHQTGLPLIRVNTVSPNEIVISQESYGPNPRKVNTTVLDPNELWYVPISYHNEDDPDVSDRNQQPKFWIAKNISSVNHEVDTTKWLFINTASTGYFRVLYDDNLRLLLRQQFERDSSVICPASRSQIIDDYFTYAFSTVSVSPIEHAMDFTTYLGQEDRLAPWLTLFNNLGNAFDYFCGSARYYNVFKNYFAGKLNSSLHLIGVEQSSEPKQGDKAILRARLLQWGCLFGLPACYEYADKLRLEWVNATTVNPVPVDIRSAMYCAIVAGGGEAGYYFALGKFFEDTTAWRNALGCATDPDVIDMYDRVLELSLNSQSGISKSDASGLLQRVAMSPEGRPRLWTFLQNRLPDIISYHNVLAIGSAVSTLSDYLSDPEDYTNLQNFISENEDALQGQLASLALSLRMIDLNIGWMNDYGLSMVQFFEDQK